MIIGITGPLQKLVYQMLTGPSVVVKNRKQTTVCSSDNDCSLFYLIVSKSHGLGMEILCTKYEKSLDNFVQ